MKVLTEKGKEVATVQLPYYKQGGKITGVNGRTTHPDGTVVPLDVKPENLVIAQSTEDGIYHLVFTLPSVEVGSVLEYSWVYGYPPNSVPEPVWDVQLPYFVHKAHYSYVPFSVLDHPSSYITDKDGTVLDELICWELLPPGAAVQKLPPNGIFTLDVTNVPPAPDEDWMPPIETQLYKVRFYYKDKANPQRWWTEAGKRWEKPLNQFANPSKPLQVNASLIVSPTDTDLVKAQKIYTAVQALDNTDFTRAKSASERKQLKLAVQKHAEDTWTQKGGSSEEIALLYLAMLRAAGLKAYPAQVADRSERTFDPTYLTLSQLTDTLIIFIDGDKEIFLDPGEKMCPFGQLAWNHTLTSGLRQQEKGTATIATPESDYSQNSVVRSGDLALDNHGGVSGRLQIIMNGQPALRWRQLALENDDTELKKQFDKALESDVPSGVEAHVDHFLGLDNPNINLIAVVNVTGTLGVPTSKRILLPGYFFEARGRIPFVTEDTRETDVDMHYGDVVTDHIVYHLPEGTTVEGAPHSADFTWPDHAHYITGSVIAPGQITITRSFARSFTLAKPPEYQELQDLYQKVFATDRDQLVLTAANPSAAPPAQGH
jgi:transglutaminase-like putative cysteine protease